MLRLLTCFSISCCLLANNAVLAQEISPVPFAPADYVDDDTITLVYDPKGEFWLAHPNDDGGRESSVPLLTTIQVVSSSDFFFEFHWCQGFIDACARRQAFNLDPSGFASLPSLRVTPGLNGEQVSNLLTVSGSLAGGGPIAAADIFVVPEPSSILPVLAAALFLVLRRHS